MSSVVKLRERNKQKFGKYLKQFADSQQFISLLRSTLGDGYRTVQYEACYKHQTLQILCYQLSSMGNSTTHKLFQMSVADRYQEISKELDHVAKTGLGQLIIDSNNNVCLFSVMYDHVDQAPAFNTNNKKVLKFRELFSYSFSKDETYQKLIASQTNDIKYGDIIHLDRVVIRPDLIGKGLFGLDILFAIAALMDYKLMYVVQTHPWSIAAGNKLIKRSKFYNGLIEWKRTSYYNYSNFIFKDGTSIDNYYQRLSEIGFNVKKLKQDSIMVVLWAVVRDLNAHTISQVIDMWYRSRITKSIQKHNRQSKL